MISAALFPSLPPPSHMACEGVALASHILRWASWLVATHLWSRGCPQVSNGQGSMVMAHHGTWFCKLKIWKCLKYVRLCFVFTRRCHRPHQACTSCPKSKCNLTKRAANYIKVKLTPLASPSKHRTKISVEQLCSPQHRPFHKSSEPTEVNSNLESLCLWPRWSVVPVLCTRLAVHMASYGILVWQDPIWCNEM